MRFKKDKFRMIGVKEVIEQLYSNYAWVSSRLNLEEKQKLDSQIQGFENDRVSSLTLCTMKNIQACNYSPLEEVSKSLISERGQNEILRPSTEILYETSTINAQNDKKIAKGNVRFTPHVSHFTSKIPAFTLAEVLVTLGIIGVVAAMTMSMLMPHLERIRNAAVLKRAYSDMHKYIDAFSYKYDCYDKLTLCSPPYEFKKDLAKYLVEEQGFVNICPDKGWAGWIYYLPYRGAKNTSLGQCRKNDLSYGASYLRSRSGYAVYITDFMSDDYYRIGKDTFRLKISIVTDINKTTRINNVKWDNENNCFKDYQIIYPQQGRNMFDIYVMNSKKIIPAGSSLCKGSRGSWTYYCTGDLENGCSKEKGNFTQCTQKVIDDGWSILYEY